MQLVEIIGQEVAPLQSLPGPHGLIDIYDHCTFGPTTERQNTPAKEAKATAGHYTRADGQLTRTSFCSERSS